MPFRPAARGLWQYRLLPRLRPSPIHYRDLEDGRSPTKGKAYLNQMQGDQPIKRELLISTEKKGNTVVVTIENVSEPKAE